MYTLLDTHTFIWFINGDYELSAQAKNTIEADISINLVSIASLWEIAIKVSLGKLELNVPFNEIAGQIKNNGFQLLPITVEDTDKPPIQYVVYSFQLLPITVEDLTLVASLPFHHRDPFDRIIIAQALRNKASIVTKDDQFKEYGVTAIW